jgi:DNA-binding CsgD family transcriptional regulator
MSKGAARTSRVRGGGPLERGRAAFERRAWEDAFVALSQADQGAALAAEDLQRLVWSAGLTGRDEDLLRAQERLYNLHLQAGDERAAARTAFWLGFRLFARGEAGRAGGWIGRAQRLVEKDEACVERGYLFLAAGQRHAAAGELAATEEAAAQAARIGERFHDADLVALARSLHGRMLLAQGRWEPGIALMDEAMLAVGSGELSPLVTGLIYCAAIASCHRAYAFDRAREWTAALTRWCDAQPQLVMFTSNCLVHRAEILQLGGAWPEAIEEARRAGAQSLRGTFDPTGVGRAAYQQAEIHRLRGEFAAAEQAYRSASESGVEPQPGLALLRLAQGQGEAAASAIRRVVGATTDRLQRTRFLPAAVEILLAVDAREEAEAATRELEESAALFKTEVLSAIAGHARGALHLAQGNAGAAVDPLRRAFAAWQQLGAPYLAARLRALLARACLALDDAEGARLELAAAQEVFRRLGAAPDLAAADALETRLGGPRDKGRALPRGLTARELQVLRLIATGKTNKAIARELSLSEKTVDRHVSNIFTKVDVSSRAAATAFAYQHQLL